MKKLLILALALMLACVPALSEAARGTFVEFDAAAGLYTYHSPLKYELLMYRDYFSIEAFDNVEVYTLKNAEIGEATMNIVCTDIPESEAEAFLGEAIGGYEPDSVSEVVQGETQGMNKIWSMTATTDGQVELYAVVTNGSQTLVVSAFYPESCAPACNELFSAMLASIVF